MPAPTPSFTITIPDIQHGPGMLWRVPAPPPGQLLKVDSNGVPTPTGQVWATGAVTYGSDIVDTNGNIQRCVVAGTAGTTAPTTWGSAYGATTIDGSVTWCCLGPIQGFGGSEGAITFNLTAKVEEVQVDQETAPILGIMTGESGYIEATLKEAALTKIAQTLAHATYTAPGAGTGTPPVYTDQITVGGLVTVNMGAIAVITQRRNVAAGLFCVACLYNTYPKEALQLGFTRTKETTYKAHFGGLALLNRGNGDKVGQYYRQMSSATG